MTDRPVLGGGVV